ncbi:MAG: ABC transporter permease [Lysobacterales bacterium]
MNTAIARSVSRRASLALLWALMRRDLRERYLGTLSGILWAFLGPGLTLLIFAFVFQTLLQVRVPAAGGSGSFVPYLALGLWPWYAFADAVQRGTNAILGNAPLLGKIALPRHVLVLVPVFGSFAIHLLGFVAVLLALAVAGTSIDWGGLPMVALGLLGALVLAAGIAFWLATLNVFVRDVSALLPQLLTFWMLVTPIFFSTATLSPRLTAALSHNPMMVFIDAIRAALLGLAAPALSAWWPALLVSAIALASGLFVFARAAEHFEDYL